MVSAMWGGSWDVRRFEEIDSTNAYLRHEARRGASEGTVAVADHQSSGRGRLDRRWESPPGASLLASVLFRPDFDPTELHLCTAAMALAARDACGQAAGVQPDVKWPNDLLVGEAKLAGILAETEFDGGSCALVVGIGLNVDWPGPPGVGGTCLRDVISTRTARGGTSVQAAPIDRAALLSALLEALSLRRRLLDSAPGRRQVAAELRDRCVTLGKRVRVALASEELVGMATDIDDAGHLVVQADAGRRVVSAGDVVHLRPG
jgi:BirA family biotin operon repressor/biotin-[acetyl-CoA-carboxylase] ligase